MSILIRGGKLEEVDRVSFDQGRETGRGVLTWCLLIRGGKPDDPTGCISRDRLQTAHSHHRDHPYCQRAPPEGADAPHDLPATYAGRMNLTEIEKKLSERVE